MKPLHAIRRANLQALVEQEGAQVAVARRIRKDKNQIHQWLLPPDQPSARNMGNRSAREIEAEFGKPIGWIDVDHSNAISPTHIAEESPAHWSQSTGHEVEKMREAILWLRDQFRVWGKEFVVEDRIELVLAVYNELITPSEPNMIDLSQRLAERVKKEDGVKDNERQRKAASTR